MAAIYFSIDPHSGVPVYRQLMDQVKHCLGSGTLKVGDQLPSIRELSRLLAVNPTTIVKAYNELQHEGVIEMKQGRGAFIADGGRRLSESQRREILRRMARQLAVEASQMRAEPETVIRLLSEEMERMNRQ